jgi:hypothetical protein
MIRHQTPGPYINLAFVTPFGHQLDIGKVIVITKENLLTTVSALGYVMWVAGNDYACDSDHNLP